MKIGFVRLDDRQLYNDTRVSVLEPLGLEYLLSNIGIECEVKSWDLNIGDEFKDYYDCEFICITIPTPLYNQAKKLIKQIHETSNSKIIVGGPHASIFPDECINDLNSDYVVVGEGENVIKQIIDNPEIKIHKQINPIDINNIKFPKKINKGKYKLDIDYNENQVVASVITARSCPYPCTFCSSKMVFGNKLRMRSVNNIIEELEFLKEQDYNTLIFLDDTFTFNRDRTIELCKRMNNLNFEWWVDTRVDKVDDELLGYMKEAGCSFIVYGIESGNEEILKRIKKGINIEQIRKAVSLTKRLGIKCKANLMLGHYQETMQQMTDTIKLGLELQADKTSFYKVIPLPGTELFKYITLENTLEYDRFKWYGNNIPAICDKTINPEKLNTIQEMAYNFLK